MKIEKRNIFAIAILLIALFVIVYYVKDKMGINIFKDRHLIFFQENTNQHE